MKGVRYNVDSFDYICHVFENAFTMTVAPESRFKIDQAVARRRRKPIPAR